MPVGRAAYLRQLGAAAALNHLKMWGVICIVVFLVFRFIPGLQIPLEMLIFILLVGTLYQFWTFGAAVWTALSLPQGESRAVHFFFFIADGADDDGRH